MPTEVALSGVASDSIVMIGKNAPMATTLPMSSRWRSWRLAVTIVALLAATTACSDDDPAADDTVAPEVESSTNAPPDSTPVTDPSPSSTATSATEPAPTTTVLMSEEAAAAAVVALFDEWTACLAAMPDCDPATVSSDSTTGVFRDSRSASAAEFSAAGYSFENLESLRIVVESATVDDVNGLARVVTCAEDAGIGLTANGDVFDDRFVSYRWEWELVASGGRWLGANRTEIAKEFGEGNTLCV